VRCGVERDAGNGATMVFFTVTIPALGHTAIHNQRCVVPTHLDAPGYTDSQNSSSTDSFAVCTDMQVVFTYAVDEPERRMDTVRVALPEFAPHETGVGVQYTQLDVFVPLSTATATARRRLLATDADVVFSTTFTTLPHSAFSRESAVLANNQATTLECGTASIPVAYTHELLGTGLNGVNVTVPRATLPTNGTLACSLVLPRLGFTSARTLTTTGLHQFAFFTPGPGATFTAAFNTTNIRLNVTFHSSGIPPATVVVPPPTDAELAAKVTDWANATLIILSTFAGFAGIMAPLFLFGQGLVKMTR
jgi:hypothetical protein